MRKGQSTIPGVITCRGSHSGGGQNPLERSGFFKKHGGQGFFKKYQSRESTGLEPNQCLSDSPEHVYSLAITVKILVLVSSLKRKGTGPLVSFLNK